jgi:hypothetical protein
MKLAVSIYPGKGNLTGGIYLSNDGGLTWNIQTAIPQTNNWSALSSSSDGTKHVIGGQTGGVYVTLNSGATWIQTPLPTGVWASAACSSDGSKIIIAQQPGSIYRSDTFGLNWATTTMPDQIEWTKLTSSADGTYLVGGTSFNGVWSFIDSTWKPQLTLEGATGPRGPTGPSPFRQVLGGVSSVDNASETIITFSRSFPTDPGVIITPTNNTDPVVITVKRITGNNFTLLSGYNLLTGASTASNFSWLAFTDI